MICRLCLTNSEKYLEFFNQNGLLLKLATIVSKYFWFKPHENDPISNIICNNCWNSIENFHKFYTTIEQAQKTLDDIKSNVINTVLKVEEKYENLQDIDGEIENHLSNYLDIKTDIVNDIKENSSNNFGNLEKNSNVQIVEKTSDKQSNLKPVRKKVNRVAKTENTKKYVMIKPSNLNPIFEDANDKVISSFLKLICDECQDEFSKFMLLKKHVRTTHNRSGYVNCCHKKFYKRILLLEHVNVHLNPDYFKCHDCNKSFGTKQSYNDHNLTHHQTNESKIYNCDLCPRKYAKKYLVAQHYKRSHIRETEKMWKCEICEKTFITKNRMMTHQNIMHKNAYSKICEICAKFCRNKLIFNKHMLEHNGIIEPKVQCEQCKVWLKNSLSLKKHLKRHKEENVEHICNLCGKIAPSNAALKCHLRNVHTEPIHKCTICEKSFKKPLGLKEHMSTHTGEILYTCGYCPKTFNSNANMWSHKKKVHRIQWEIDRKNRKMK